MDVDIKDDGCIDVGRYIVLQRQKYTKLHRFGGVNSCVSLGKDQIELANAVRCKYFTTFKMIPKGRGKGRLYSLKVADDAANGTDVDTLNDGKSGSDNRNIIDDGKSQKLTTEEIVTLRENLHSSSDILETLVSNSNTFHSKTEYSQAKYIKKKQKKYYEYLTIKKPTLRLIAEIMYRQDPGKVCGLRPDTLSQLISYANLSSDSNCLLYDSGSSGLVAAAILNSLGDSSDGALIHAHPGNNCQKQALLAMNYSSRQSDKHISVNLYSVLRDYYQKDNALNQNEILSSHGKRKMSEDTEEAIDCKVPRIESDLCDSEEKEPKQMPKWILDNERACQFMRNKMDSLVIVSKEHPLNVFQALVPFIKLSRPFVIYNQYQEPIQDCYMSLKKMPNVACLKMFSSWLREYQVLENRTHPDVLMQGNGGFLIHGWIVQ